MASINAQIEYAILRMMTGAPAPAAAFTAIEDAAGQVPDWEATQYEIPDGFPNPPPPRPLRGEVGARFILAQCGCTVLQSDALVAQGFKTPERFMLFGEPSSIDNLINNLFRIPANDGGCKIPAATTILLKAAVSWIGEQKGYGAGIIDAYQLSLPELLTWEQSFRAHRGNGQASQALIDKPVAFDTNKWVSWKDGIVNYLSNVTGVSGVPLAYVIRDHITFTDTGVTPLSTLRIKNTAHSGPSFQEDNVAVYSVLHQSLLSTDGYTHIAEHEGTKDGKAAFATLCLNYDGPSAVSNRIAWAKQEVQQAVYKSEATFTLDKYGNRLANAYRILRQNGQPKNPSEEVDCYLNQINTTNPEIAQAVSMLRFSGLYDTDFQKARAKLQEMVSKHVWQRSAHQANVTGTTAARRVSQVKEAKARHGGKGKGGQGGGGKSKEIEHKGDKEFYDGVDITDPTRKFSNQEFKKIRPIFKDHILPHRPPRNHQANVSAVEKQKQSNGNKFGTNQYD